jgi:hypothetical protein
MKLTAALESRALGRPGQTVYVVSFDPLPEFTLDEYDQQVLAAESIRQHLLLGRSADASGIMTLVFALPLKQIKEALRRNGDLPELVAIMPDVAVPLQR